MHRLNHVKIIVEVSIYKKKRTIYSPRIATLNSSEVEAHKISSNHEYFTKQFYPVKEQGQEKD